MTNRWINVVLTILVVAGMGAYTWYERPRAAEERARLLGQEVTSLEDFDEVEERDPLAGLPGMGDDDPEEVEATATPEQTASPESTPALSQHGVTSSHPLAVEVGMGVLDAGGTAVDAAIAISYALGVVEPFGSGIGGGGAMLIHEVGEEPVGYDYRETAPTSGEIPASNIGVPGFVAGMEHIHAEHATFDLADLMDPAIAYAAGGFEVGEYLADRLAAAAHRLPINLIPELFPDGRTIAAGETLVQPRYAEALMRIQEEGAEAFYDGVLGEQITEEVAGLELDDLADYEVLETPPVTGTFAGFDVIGAGVPVSGATLIQLLHIAEALGLDEMEPEGPDYTHRLAQAYRIAMSDRTEHIADPTFEDVPLEDLLDPAYAEELAALIPEDGFVSGDLQEDEEILLDSDTTHFVVVDRAGTMVSATNTLGNFFGSGLAVSGFFLNDQLRNFSRDPESVNAVAPGKRPRSFITPVILAADDRPVIGIGSPGGRRIPIMVAQVLIRWAGHGERIGDATAGPRFHLERRRLYTEHSMEQVRETLPGYGYELADEPVTEFYGGIQALVVDHEEGVIDGVADDRRPGDWASD